MQQAIETLTFRTDGTGLHEVTSEIADWLGGTGIATVRIFPTLSVYSPLEVTARDLIAFTPAGEFR